MRIGIDIDGVLTNIEQFLIDYLSKYCVENNIKFNIGISNYQVSKSFNITSEQEDDFWNKYIENYATNEKARPFAAEVIKKLKEDGNEIYIITARLNGIDDNIRNDMIKIVKEWLIKIQIVYDKLVFSKSESENKLQEIIDNEIDLMIEDNPNNINQLSSVVPIICYNAGYNRECIGDKITRCYSWYDIYRTIQDIENT